MKALITIIILALVAWGIWWFVKGNNTDIENNPAAAGSAIDIGSGEYPTPASADVDATIYGDKG